MSTLVRRLLPPLVVDAARRVREAVVGSEWRVAPDGFAAARAHAGWDDPSIVETQAARWAGLVARAETRAPLDLSSEADASATPDEAAHNSVMVFAYALARAAHGRDALSLLDWGGGLGQYGVLARALLPEVRIEYHCRDRAALVARGRTLLRDATFHDDDACLARRYDLVLASSSLQYHEDWRATLAALARASARWLLVTRTPVTLGGASWVAVQRPHAHGYRTEYAGWVIARAELLAAASAAGLALAREFLVQEHPRIPNAPSECVYRGFLFQAPEAAR